MARKTRRDNIKQSAESVLAPLRPVSLPCSAQLPVSEAGDKAPARAKRLRVLPAHRAFLGGDSNRQNERVADREYNRGGKFAADHRGCGYLDHNCAGDRVTREAI